MPVDLRGSDWAAQIKGALGATYFFHTGGSCINLRCAHPGRSACGAVLPGQPSWDGWSLFHASGVVLWSKDAVFSDTSVC